MTFRPLLVAVLLLGAAHSIPLAQGNPHFDAFLSPTLPGQRTVSATIDFKGIPADRMKVFIVYSDDRATVARAFAPRTRTGREPSADAKCGAPRDGAYRCSAIIPHGGDRSPNARDLNPKAYPPGTKVYFAWGKEFVPGGATEALTLHSEVQEFVVPRKATIALLGDSYASGEGAPARALTRNLKTANGALDNGEGMWLDTLCHRSTRGGLLKGAKQLVEDVKGIEFDILNVTCSGATIGDGLMTNQFIEDAGFPMDPGNRKPGGSKPAQVEQVLDWLTRHDYSGLDALVMSIGGNDIGFDWLVTTCLAAIFSDCDDDTRDVFRQGVRDLVPSYAALDAHIRGEFQARNRSLGEIFITEYADPTRNAKGGNCSDGLTRGAGNPFDCWGPLEAQISADDFQFMHDELLVGLNNAVTEGARANGWTLIDGIADASKKKGLCVCDGGYFNTLGQSDHLQGDLYGSVHPNARGYAEAYAPAVQGALSKYFRVTRVLAAERAQTRPVVSAPIRHLPLPANAIKAAKLRTKLTPKIPQGPVPPKR